MNNTQLTLELQVEEVITLTVDSPMTGLVETSFVLSLALLFVSISIAILILAKAVANRIESGKKDKQ